MPARVLLILLLLVAPTRQLIAFSSTLAQTDCDGSAPITLCCPLCELAGECRCEMKPSDPADPQRETPAVPAPDPATPDTPHADAIGAPTTPGIEPNRARPPQPINLAADIRTNTILSILCVWRT